MSYTECPICKEFTDNPRHKCAPAWLVWGKDSDESEAYTFYDQTEYGVAERYCQHMDEGESKPRNYDVYVWRKEPRSEKEKAPKLMEMRGEIVFQYFPF